MEAKDFLWGGSMWRGNSTPFQDDQNSVRDSTGYMEDRFVESYCL